MNQTRKQKAKKYAKTLCNNAPDHWLEEVEQDFLAGFDEAELLYKDRIKELEQEISKLKASKAK